VGKHGSFEDKPEGLLARIRTKGKNLGITGETEVERLSDEYRRDKKR
jgi:hypothetical protein